MSAEWSFTINPEHPCLAGHFPGDPLVPGAVLLDLAIEYLERRFGRKVVGIPSAKFILPVRPSEEVGLELHDRPEGLVAVTGRLGDRIAFSFSAALAEFSEKNELLG